MKELLVARVSAPIYEDRNYSRNCRQKGFDREN